MLDIAKNAPLVYAPGVRRHVAGPGAIHHPFYKNVTGALTHESLSFSGSMDASPVEPEKSPFWTWPGPGTRSVATHYVAQGAEACTTRAQRGRDSGREYGGRAQHTWSMKLLCFSGYILRRQEDGRHCERKHAHTGRPVGGTAASKRAITSPERFTASGYAAGQCPGRAWTAFSCCRSRRTRRGLRRRCTSGRPGAAAWRVSVRAW